MSSPKLSGAEAGKSMMGEEKGFLVDECFEQGLGRLLENHPIEHQLLNEEPMGLLEGSSQLAGDGGGDAATGRLSFHPPDSNQSYKRYAGGTTDGEDGDVALWTFEEFIQCTPPVVTTPPASGAKKSISDVGGESEGMRRPISNCGDGFFNVALDSPRFEEQQRMRLERGVATEGVLPTRNHNERTSCYHVTRDARESSAAPNEQLRVYLAANLAQQTANPSSQPTITPEPSSHAENGHNELKPDCGGGGAIHSVARFLCCVRAPHSATVRYEADGRGDSKVTEVTTLGSQQYSWDKRQLDANDYRFVGKADEVLVKEPGEVNGQQFCIEECIDSVILVLDRSASVNIDDCQNCVIVLGPSAGSVFVRDSSKCLIYAICQQFRSRDSHRCQAHLFCATAPTIEESQWDFWPLWISYAGLAEQVYEAGLSPFVNRWRDVHNFTPELAQHSIMAISISDRGRDDGVTFVTPALTEKWRQLLLRSPDVLHSLSVHPEESYFLNSQPRIVGDIDIEESMLVVTRNFHRTQLVQPSLRNFYNEAIFLLRSLLSKSPGVKLVGTKDISLKPGEWETLMREKTHGHNKSCGGRVVCFELQAPNAGVLRDELASLIKHLQQPSSATGGHTDAVMAFRSLVELVPVERTEFTRTQLYRLFDIQQSV